MMLPVTIQYGVGCVKLTFTVWESSASTCLTLRKTPTNGEPVAGSAVYSAVETTAWAVNGLPSCQLTPRLSFHVTDIPSFATPPFCSDGTSWARTGTRLPSGLKYASGS